MSIHQAYFWGDHYPASDVVHVNSLIRNGRRVYHNHDYAEIALTMRGSGEFRSPSLSKSLRRGVLIIVPPGVDHTYTNCRQAHFLFCSVRTELIESMSLSLGIKPSIWTEMGLGRPSPEAQIFVSQIDQAVLPLYVKTLTKIIAAHCQRGIRAQFTLLGSFFSFLGLILTHQRTYQSLGSNHGTMHLQTLTTRALSFLRTDLTRQWSMEDLSGSLNNVHPVHLCRVFKRDMNMTPMSYLRNLRCQYAAQLLSTSDQPISAIGSSVGWNDPNLFSRRFRAILGKTPTAYRTAYKKVLDDT